MDFCRSLDQNEIAQCDEMLDLLGGTALSDNQDTVRWALEKSGLYTTRSMYRVLSHRAGGGVINKLMQWCKDRLTKRGGELGLFQISKTR